MIFKKPKYTAAAILLLLLFSLFGLAVSAADETPVVPIDPPKVTAIEIGDMPIKTQYLVGEKLDMSGSTLKLTYDNGSTGEDVIKTSWCSGFSSTAAGTKTITVTYPDTSCKVTFKVEVVTETSLKIVKPEKLAYFVGDKEDRSGLAVSVVYSNGKSELLDPSAYTVSGFSSNTIGEKKITVKYKTLTASYNVNVVEPALLSIKIAKNPSKLSYYVGEKLDTAGIKVTASYEDGKTADVTSKVTFKGDISVSGVRKIEVVYSERDYIKTATFNVTVTAVQIKSIKFVSYPKKTVYAENEIFDPAGISIQVTYNNGTVETRSDDLLFTGFDTKTIGTKTMALHYGGKQLEFTVEVVVSAQHVHKETEFAIVKAPTCTVNGEQATTCTVCGEIVTVRSIPALGHGDESAATQTKAPTCTEPGQMATYCMVCREPVTVSDIFPLGHNAGEPVTDPAPTCIEGGRSKTFCTVCMAEIDSKYIDALGHSFGVWTIEAVPTGESEGREDRICSVCSFTESRKIAKLENVLVSGDVAAAINPSTDYYPFNTAFTAEFVTSSLGADELAALIPEGEYRVIEVFDLYFTNGAGEKIMPAGEITYSVSYALPEGYESFLVYDTSLGRYTPMTGEESFSFTVARVGRFILVGDPVDVTTAGENTSEPEGSESSALTVSMPPENGSSAMILVLLIIAVILLVITGALVYTYAFKQYLI